MNRKVYFVMGIIFMVSLISFITAIQTLVFSDNFSGTAINNSAWSNYTVDGDYCSGDEFFGWAENKGVNMNTSAIGCANTADVVSTFRNLYNLNDSVSGNIIYIINFSTMFNYSYSTPSGAVCRYSFEFYNSTNVTAGNTNQYGFNSSSVTLFPWSNCTNLTNTNFIVKLYPNNTAVLYNANGGINNTVNISGLGVSQGLYFGYRTENARGSSWVNSTVWIYNYTLYNSSTPTSCIPPAINNNWNVNFQDNCTLTNYTNLGVGNLTLSGGPGTFTLNATLQANQENLTCSTSPCLVVYTPTLIL